MFSLTRFVAPAAVVFTASGALLAEEEHFDVAVGLDGNRLITGTIEEDGSNPVFGERVFGAEFGEGLDPFVTDEPGFQTPLAPTLPEGTGLGFSINTSLLAWDGSGFSSTASSIRAGLEGGGLFIDSPVGDTVETGFVFEVAGADGEIHTHLDFELLNPLNGVFLLELSLWTDNSSIEASAPIWMVFNNGLDEVTHDTAIDYVRDNIVPSPSSMALMGVFGLAAARRRRR